MRILLLCCSGILAAQTPETRSVPLTGAVTIQFVRLPAGSFVMGSDESEVGRARDESPRHKVTIMRPFFIGKFEVTQEQWNAVMGGNPSVFARIEGWRQLPVERVSWDDAQTFLKKLNAMQLGRFRLPSEAEWEYACRAGSEKRFPWGDDADYRQLAQHAWFYSRAEGRSHPVGSRQPNAWGLHDLSGNVWEWVADWYAPYGNGDQTDPQGPAQGTEHGIRGGSWFNEPEAQRCANRHRHPSDSRQTNIGIRLIWEPPAER
ncbi:MAG: formylglycine-generating enzyme family protein [Bryobacterales bacterium]|nr:formylglycine-generating enzyme family protein [Bryobacterales bacterium]